MAYRSPVLRSQPRGRSAAALLLTALSGLLATRWYRGRQPDDTRAPPELAGTPRGLQLVTRGGTQQAFDGSGRWLADGSGRVWDLDAPTAEPTVCDVPRHTSGIDLSPDGRWLAATSTGGEVAVCDARTGLRVATLFAGGEGNGARFAPDGALLAVVTWSGTRSAWRTAAWEPTEGAWTPAPRPTPDVSGWTRRSWNTLEPLAHDAQRDRFAWVTTDAVEMRAGDGHLLASRRLPYAVHAVFSAEGRRVAIVGWSRGEVWDAEAFEQVNAVARR